jgi:transcriptional regulator of acetoin/glycerol metabolism
VTADAPSVTRKQELVAALQKHRGNVAAIARDLSTSRAQVHRLLQRFQLDPDAYR